MAIQCPPSQEQKADPKFEGKKSPIAQNLEPTAFPPLPDKSYRAHATEHVTSSISGASPQGSNISRSSILQLAWALIISSHAGSDDVSFGLCIARCPVQPDSIRPFCLTINRKHSVDEALKSLELAKSATSLCRDELSATSSPMFPNILLIVHGPCPTPDAKTTEYLPGGVSSHSLSLTGHYDRNTLNLALSFDPIIISSMMGQMIMEQLVHVVGYLQSRRACNLEDLLGPGPRGLERIMSWNSRINLRKSESCVHEVIAQRCHERPLAPAVCAWDGNLDYSQLDKLANRLCSLLTALIPDPESFVGLLLDKSMWTVVSIVAVMKSGHAFFFLDPSLPDQRLQTLCRISQSPIILTSPEQSSRAQRMGLKSLVVKDECQVPLESTASPLPKVRSDQAVYLAFTSGSTGEPKGVVIEHTAVCSGVDAYATAMGLNYQSRVFQFASYSFVISILDHLVSLMRGACLCIASEAQIQDNLLNTMNAFEANWVEITPSVARTLLPDSIPSLNTLCLTGESMTRADLDKWHGKVNLKTCYGQSENSLGALLDTKTTSSHSIDLGYPFAANCWIVDPRDHNMLVPIGAEGELLLEGPSLARGYLHNEEQTDAAFISDPVWMQHVRPGACSRFLRTGDIVRYRPENGSIQYIGRSGTQVKLRGQRIELAEVEFQLKKQFSTSDAVVAEIITPSQERSHDAVLVAFVTVTSNKKFGDVLEDSHLFAQPSAEFIRQSHDACSQLHNILPKYMVPMHYVPLTALPLTPSGKLDRRLLRNQAAELKHRLRDFQPRFKNGYRQPNTENESSLRDMCASILSSEPDEINMNDTFFEIGGNSITAMQLATQASKSGFSFRMEQLFQQVSLATLANHRAKGKPEKEISSASNRAALDDNLIEKVMQKKPPALEKANIADIFPCLPTQKWLFDVHEGGCFLFRFNGLLDLGRLKAACHRLVELHAALRSLFVDIDGIFHQVVLSHMNFSFNVHTITTGDHLESVAKTLCQKDGKGVFQLGIPPLQFMLVPGSAQQHMLILQLSHAQYDGSCQEILASDLCSLYKDPLSLAPPADYGSYAREVAARQDPAAFDFWKGILAGSTITALPYKTSEAGNLLLECSMETTVGSPPRGITMASVVKAAWSQVLHEVTGSDDIVFAQLVSLRGIDVPGIHRTVGLCLNRVPVRVQFHKAATASELLHDLQSQHVQCMPFEAAGWDNIVSNSTSWSAGSRAQSLVIHQNFSAKSFFQVEDGLACELPDHVAIEPPPESLELYSELEGDKLKLKLTGPSRMIGKTELHSMLQELCTSLQHFTTALGSSVETSI